ncbi:hypothetical protein [Janthinobacterium sp. RA13]|uniref:hypothetical protein n=1 Tax=Janthinobacterium sp. RA13 TaxID=1502762 RepID=UPI0005644757|nr:hypothetical protein [Janthinobacterium sp. RA13]
MLPAGQKLTYSIALGAGYVLAQLALTAWAGTRAPWVSYAFNIVAPLLALAACCRCAYVSAAGAPGQAGPCSPWPCCSGAPA